MDPARLQRVGRGGASASGNASAAVAAGALQLRRELGRRWIPPRSTPSLELAAAALELAEAADDPRCSPQRMPSSARSTRPRAISTRHWSTRAEPCSSLKTRASRAPVSLGMAAGRVLREATMPDDALLASYRAVDTLDRKTLAAAHSRSGFGRNVLPLYEEYADLMLASMHGRAGPMHRPPCARSTEPRAAADRRGPQLLREPVLGTRRFRSAVPQRARRRDLSAAFRGPARAPREHRRRADATSPSRSRDAELTRRVRLLREAIEDRDSGRRLPAASAAPL